MVKFKLNGIDVEAEEGTTILKAAKELSIDIPTLCYHPAIEPYQVCRVCLVEMKKDIGEGDKKLNEMVDYYINHREKLDSFIKISRNKIKVNNEFITMHSVRIQLCISQRCAAISLVETSRPKMLTKVTC